jgi:dihydropteroate synthase
VSPADFDAWLITPKPARRPLVMGVLNVTPDSFSDGGKFASTEAAVEQARSMVSAGANLIDIGGESTRPGSQSVPAAQQIERVIPVLRAVAGLPIVFSIDTTDSAVASAALDAGAVVINDISAGRNDPNMLPLAASRKVPVILMHMQGTPATMQDRPNYSDVMGEVIQFLRERIRAAEAAGLAGEKTLIDPGIGFGKTLDHNLSLMRQQRELLALGRPVVIGTSRKGFIGKITGETEPSKRLFGTAASVAWSITSGADIVRVHDVGPMTQVVRMMRAIIGGDTSDFLTR